MRRRADPAIPDERRGARVTRVRVNPIGCVAHGLCAEILPEWIALDEWGYPIVERGSIPAQLEDLARRAADACPTLALLLERD